MGRTLGGTLVLAAAALAACSSRSGGGAVPAAASPYAARPGFVPGLRLRADTPSLSDEQAAREASRAASYAEEESSYGPSGDEGRPWCPADGWGTLPPGAGYYGPLGAVEPGLRAPSDAPLLQPASPYRGPTDPPSVIERPGLRAENHFFRRP
jgi:hypothetical protein